MVSFPNLVSESVLVADTIKLLQSLGGQASAVKIVERVMKIRKPEPNFAKLLVSDLVNSDPRLNLADDKVEFIPFRHDSRKLSETDYVVFDFETTGAKCPPCRVTEIGAYRISNGEIGDSFHSLLNPEGPIPSFITQLTGISDAMVADAPKFREIASEFLHFIGDSVLVAHNARFDITFLNHEVGLIHQGYKVANPHLCTVLLSRRLVPHIENHKLNTVAEHFRINLENHHRALDDAQATAKIFIELLAKLEAKGIKDLAGARKVRS